jgi:chorismate lyase/3-hydroxybenzoate synthase
MNAQALHPPASAALMPSYAFSRDPRSLLGPRTLAVFGFGSAAPAAATVGDPRYVRVGLQPLDGPAPYEVWTVDSTVELWRDGPLAGARSTDLSFGHLQSSEEAAGTVDCAEQAYHLLDQHRSTVGNAHPHLLRIWNYLDAITDGDGDDERYRQFCIGRANALSIADRALPAATAIGHRLGDRSLQVYWLSGSQPGRAVENPRQLPAYRYPRRYGPRSPSFARAMLGADAARLPLLLSGTAAVVGHDSLHPESVSDQLRETFRNFDSLLATAARQQPGLALHFDASSLLKVYLRDAESLPEARSLLARLLPPDVPRLILEGDICRRELAVEIDGVHG